MIIGIEGVSCTGKTTLAVALAERIDRSLVIPCYFHSVADPSTLPPPVAENERAQLAGLRAFLDVEQVRRDQALAGCADGRTVILDRTVDTLLAHTRAVGRLQGFDADETARQITRQRRVAVPDVTLLLTARFAVLRVRAVRRRGMPEIFYDARFTGAFMEHFVDPISRVCITLDGEQPAPALLDNALDVLQGAAWRTVRTSSTGTPE
ncbi:MAG: hypothetical protein ACRDRX_27435 [Pseudonocardiaceae bacterium]